MKGKTHSTEEIIRILRQADGVETAFLSGLRASELRSLSINDLDLEENGVHLDASWTKNRKQGFQQLAEELVHRLCAFALANKPAQLYAKFYRSKNAKLKAPDNPLLPKLSS